MVAKRNILCKKKFLQILMIYSISTFLIGIYAQNIEQTQKACNCQLHGEVLDTQTKKPIAGALVIVKGTKKNTETDAEGHYHFEKLCHGEITLICRILSYGTIELTLNLQHDQDHEHNFRLSEEEYHLNHVEIKAQKIENVNQPKSQINEGQLSRLQGQNLGEILKDISGVSSLQTGSSISKPIIHGLHSNRILTINNGIRLESQNWGSEHAPEIDPFEAQKITILKGASGLRYGADAIGGIVILENSPLPDSASFTGQFNQIFSTNGRQIVSAGHLQNAKILKGGQSIAVRIRGTFKKAGDISTPDYRLINTGLNELNYSATIGYKSNKILTEAYYSRFNTKIGIFSGAHIGNLTDLNEAINRGRPLSIYTPEKFSYEIGRPYQLVVHDIFKLKNTLKLANSSLQITIAKQNDSRTEVDILRGSRNLSQIFYLNTTNFEAVWDHAPIKKLISGSIGLNGIFQKNLTTGTLEKPTSASVLIPNYRNLNFGFFAFERILKNKWEIEAGIRADFRKMQVYRIPRGQQSILNYNANNQNVTGTFSSNFRATNHLNLLLNLTSAWRPPSVNEWYSDGVHHGAASFEKGDENLTPEMALNSSITINYEKKIIKTEVLIYHNSIKNFIFLTPTGRPVLTIRGAFPEFWYVQTNANFTGIDFSNSLNINSLISINSKYSLLIANDITNNQPLIQMPSNRLENSIKFENKQSYISVSNQYIFKQNRIPTKLIIKSIPNEEIIYKNFGGDYTSPPPAYSLFSVALGHQFELKNKNNISTSLTINNLTNVKYRDYLNKFRYFTDEMGLNCTVRTSYSF